MCLSHYLIIDISPNFVNFSYPLHFCYFAHGALSFFYVPVVFTVWYIQAQLWPKLIKRAAPLQDLTSNDPLW